MMKKILIFILLSVAVNGVAGQKQDFVQIESNKVLSLFSFAQTAGQAMGTSPTYKEIIDNAYGNDDSFQKIVKLYRSVYLWDEIKRENYPEKRHNSRSIEEMLWIASSNAKDLDDFSERIIGYLPNAAHGELLDALRGFEPYFEELVWNKQQDQIKRIIDQLTPYKAKIEKLFLKISRFYGTNWDKEVPFKVLLYPIPAQRGMTSAIPMGNALICAFLSENENDYKGRLGVIIHEMCHVLYEEQSRDIQKQMDRWFETSKSEYNGLAYNYIDEGLATAIGNGWAYEQIHHEIDTTPWYNDPYIEGYARALYPLVKDQLGKDGTIDSLFIDLAIKQFGITFPDALRQTSILMNNLCIISNKEEEAALDEIINALATRFQLRSASLNSPFENDRTLEELKKKNTKIVCIDKDHEKALKWLKNQYGELKDKLPVHKKFLFCFKDEKKSNTVIILNLLEKKDLNKGFDALKKMEFVEYNELIFY